MTKPSRWTKHRGIAIGIASEYRVPGLDADDVRQEALVSLWQACGSYDSTKGPFPAFARLVIHRDLRDILQAATRQKRTAEFDHYTDPPGPALEQLVLVREELREALDSPVVRQRQAWRDAKRKQRAA